MKSVTSDDANSALRDAARKGKMVALADALNAGADPNSVPASGETPLFIAAENGQLPCINALLDAGAKIDLRPFYRGSSGNITRGTALTRALENGQVSAAVLLLDRGADPRVPTNQMNTPAHLFVCIKKPGLDQDGANNLLDRMLDGGEQVDRVNTGLQTVLMCAIRANAPASMVGLLLDRGANPNAMDAFGMRPIHFVQTRDKLAHLEKLLDAGADVNSQCAQGRTPLFYFEDVEIGRELIRRGANIDHRCHIGKTVLAHRLDAAISPIASDETLPFLLQCGAALDIPDYSGASVDTILAGRADTVSQQQRAVVAAFRARQAMSKIGFAAAHGRTPAR
jgi:hypothetical protein